MLAAAPEAVGDRRLKGAKGSISFFFIGKFRTEMRDTFDVVECFLDVAPGICGENERENCSRAKTEFFITSKVFYAECMKVVIESLR